MDKERAVAKTLRKTRGSLIGVYSPIHRIGKTKYALELGKELAEKGPVLYLNLEEYAGGEHYFQKNRNRIWEISCIIQNRRPEIWDFVSA